MANFFLIKKCYFWLNAIHSKGTVFTQKISKKKNTEMKKRKEEQPFSHSTRSMVYFEHKVRSIFSTIWTALLSKKKNVKSFKKLSKKAIHESCSFHCSC